MGSLVPILTGAAVGTAVGTAAKSFLRPPSPVRPPPVPQAIEPPSPADTTQASEQARKKAPRGLISQNIRAGDLVPSETFLTGKKKKLGGQ